MELGHSLASEDISRSEVDSTVQSRKLCCQQINGRIVVQDFEYNKKPSLQELQSVIE